MSAYLLGQLDQLRTLLPVLAELYAVDLSAPEQAVEEVANRLAALSAISSIVMETKGTSVIGFEEAPQVRAKKEELAYTRIIGAMLETAAKLNGLGAMTLYVATALERLKQVSDEINWPTEATKGYHQETLAQLNVAGITLQDQFQPGLSRRFFREQFRAGREGGIRTIQVYFVYANKDGKIFAELELHLRVSADIGHLNIWHRGLLSAGMEKAYAAEKLRSSEVVTCLVSAELFNEHAADVELAVELAVAQSENRPLLIVPIIIRHCLWDDGILRPFKENVLPKNRKPVIKWSCREEALYEVAKDFYAAIGKLTAREGP